MIKLLTTILVFGAALGALVFVARFRRTGWHKTEVGRNLMAFMGVSGVLLALALVRRWIPLPAWGWDWVRLGAYGALNWVIWWRVVLLFQLQRQARNEEQRKRDEADQDAR